MRDKLIKLFFFSLGLLFLISPVLAENENKITLSFFEDKLCSTCKAQKAFMENIKNNYPQLEIISYPITDTENFNRIAKEYELEDYKIMAPTSFINGNFLQFTDFTDKQEKILINAIEGKKIEDDKNTITLPILNKEFDLDSVPLLITTIILSSVDGFNICSIGALILILSIVLVSNSRKKTLLYGGLFIMTSATVYGVIVFSWGKLFETLLGQLEILRIFVGLSALIGGIYFFKEFRKFLRRGPTCESGNSKIIRDAVNKIKESFSSPNKGTLVLATNIIIFSAIITIVELPCSIGLPIVFGGILAESNLPLISYLFYVLVYLFFFMLIEIIIFTVAVFSKKIWINNSKVITWSTLVCSIFLFYLAFYYLF